MLNYYCELLLNRLPCSLLSFVHSANRCIPRTYTPYFDFSIHAFKSFFSVFCEPNLFFRDVVRAQRAPIFAPGEYSASSIDRSIDRLTDPVSICD